MEFIEGITDNYSPEINIEDKEEISLIEEIETELHAAIMDNLSEVSTVFWRMVQEATNTDKILSKVRDILQEGLQFDIRLLPDEIKQYVRYLENMYVQDDVILYGSRTVVPDRLRKRVRHPS